MKMTALIQARMGSSRLPGKVLVNVLGRPLLSFLVERLLQSQELNEIVILTTNLAEDDLIVQFCEQRHLLYFRGSEDDVLDRYYQAARQFKLDTIVRLTSDCPLIDPEVLDQVIRVFRKNTYSTDYVSNTLKRTFPRGLDVEVFSFKALEQAYRNAIAHEEREHVTLYLYRHPEKFGLKNVSHFPSLANHRWTIDTVEDLKLVRLILEKCYPKSSHFRLKDILRLLDKNPLWNQINSHIEQKKIPDQT